MAHAVPQVRRWTADEVMRMVDVGLIGEDEPLELLDGALFVRSPQGAYHSGLTALLRDALQRCYGEGFHLKDHSPVRAGDYSLPEPDVAVVRGSVRAFLDRHPGPADSPLVVEIGVSTVAQDRHKARIYAEAGFAELWLLDVPSRALHVLTGPRPTGYAHARVLTDGDTVRPPGTTVDLAVADLLP